MALCSAGIRGGRDGKCDLCWEGTDSIQPHTHTGLSWDVLKLPGWRRSFILPLVWLQSPHTMGLLLAQPLCQEFFVTVGKAVVRNVGSWSRLTINSCFKHFAKHFWTSTTWVVPFFTKIHKHLCRWFTFPKVKLNLSLIFSLLVSLGSLLSLQELGFAKSTIMANRYQQVPIFWEI